MDSFTRSILKKLRLIISLKILYSEKYVKDTYRKIAKAKTPGMLLDAIQELPEEEIQNIKEKLNNNEEKIIFSPLKLKYPAGKYFSPMLSFKFSDGDFKRKQRLEALDRIKKSKLK